MPVNINKKQIGFVVVIVITYTICIYAVSIKLNVKSIEIIFPIAVSLGAGLIAWLITELVTHVFDNQHAMQWNLLENANENIKKLEDILKEHTANKFPKHESDTSLIIELVQGKQLSLLEEKRGKVGYSFFKSYFKKAETVKISGIAMGSLFDDILKHRDEHELIKRIINQPDIDVNILMADYNAEYVKFRDETEKVDDLKCSSGIKASMIKINKIAKLIKESNWATNKQSIFQIRSTPIPFTNTLTYFKHKDKNGFPDECIMIGVIFPHVKGTESAIFNIQKNTNRAIAEIFTQASQSFNAIYESAQSNVLLSWTGNEVTINSNCTEDV